MSTDAGSQLLAVLGLAMVLAAMRVLPRTKAKTEAVDGEETTVSRRATWRKSLLRSLLVGKDNRTSTSQCVATAWTFVVVYILLSALIALWFGHGTGWNAMPDQDITGYLVLLGSPFAAATLARAQAVRNAANGTKTVAASASASQLVTDDANDTDLGDFQYVLFNAIAIAFIVARFAGHLDLGLPTMPQVLWALGLTSASGYTAKQLIANPGGQPPTDPTPPEPEASAAALLGQRPPLPGGKTNGGTAQQAAKRPLAYGKPPE